jgi:hypothetical protein
MAFKNRELAEKLNINFEKWRRWSREFAPGNTPKGYEREYLFRDAFKVYLGGHLVSQMGYSVQQAKKILSDLDTWLIDNEFYSETRFPVVKKYPNAQSWSIGISPTDEGAFCYNLKGSIEKKESKKYDAPAIVEAYHEDSIFPIDKKRWVTYEDKEMVLRLSSIRFVFLFKMDLIEQ